MPYEVISRESVNVEDAAQVNSASVNLDGQNLYAELSYTVTGGPSALELRAAVEASIDGENWHEIIRFADQTGTSGGTRIARVGSAAAGEEAALTISDLDSASASGVINDGVIPGRAYTRLVSKLETLTDGTDPTVSIVLRLSSS